MGNDVSCTTRYVSLGLDGEFVRVNPVEMTTDEKLRIVHSTGHTHQFVKDFVKHLELAHTTLDKVEFTNDVVSEFTKFYGKWMDIEPSTWTTKGFREIFQAYESLRFAEDKVTEFAPFVGDLATFYSTHLHLFGKTKQSEDVIFLFLRELKDGLVAKLIAAQVFAVFAHYQKIKPFVEYQAPPPPTFKFSENPPCHPSHHQTPEPSPKEIHP